MAGIVRIAVIEDHPLAQVGMKAVCEANPNWQVVHVGESVNAFLEKGVACDVIMLDLELRGTVVSLDEVAELLKTGAKVLVVSALSSPSQVRNFLRAGITGFVSKHESQDVLREALCSAVAGESWTSAELAAMLERDPQRPALSEQEQRALALYASGLKLQSVARIMNVKPSTVKEYIERVRAKYEVLGRHAPTKIHLARNAEQDGYL